MIVNLQAGGVVQGGSTITEQYVKNAYVGDERTYTRKIREAVLAWQLEDKWSKDKILTEYLNTVYYGAGAYGVEAAARTYFHKHVSDAQPQGGRAARGAAQVPRQRTHRPPTRQAAAAQHRAAADGRPGLHHPGARRQAHEEQAPRLQAPAELQQEPRRLLRRLRDQAAHQALRLGEGVRRRPQGLHQHRHGAGSRRPSTSSSRPPRRWTSASSRRRRWSPSTRPTATSAPWSAASTTRSRSSTSPRRPSASRGPR